MINAPICGLRFNKHTDENPGAALAAKNDWMNQGLRGLLNPGTLGAVQAVGLGGECGDTEVLENLLGASTRLQCL